MDYTHLLSEIGYTGNYIGRVELLNSYENSEICSYKKNNIMNDIGYGNIGCPSDEITDADTYRDNFIDNLKNRQREYDKCGCTAEEEEKFNSILKEKLDVNIVVIEIDYPVTVKPYFKFEINPQYSVTYADLQYLHIIAYKLTYLIEESDDKDPGNIPGMLNRQTSYGRFGVWGHSIDDLIYNGLSELIVYDSDNKYGCHAYYNAGCDS